MFNNLNLIQKRLKEPWLLHHDSHDLKCIFEKRYRQLQEYDCSTPKVLLMESEPIHFIAAFLAALAAKCPIFLGNPQWKKIELIQVLDLVQPHLIWQESSRQIVFSNLQSSGHLSENKPQNLIMIPTGGTSGKIRFTMHNPETLMASTIGFSQYFETQSIDSFCILPLYHVSGLMQLIRSFTTGGKLYIDSYQRLKFKQHWQEKNHSFQDFFISLVPTQLQALLQTGAGAWLTQFKTVLLGGAPPWNSLLLTAKQGNIPLALTYGMTETASQIVTLKPQEFGSGNFSTGKVLPHAKVTITNEDGNPLQALQPGKIQIESQSLFLGYYPSPTGSHSLLTDDLGYFDSEGYLHILGRESQKIITGGEKVFPAEVESTILATNLVKDICVLGVPDHYWGERVTAIYVPKNQEIVEQDIKAAIANQLSNFKQPKAWIAVDRLPRNNQGKLNRQQLLEFLLTSTGNNLT